MVRDRSCPESASLEAGCDEERGVRYTVRTGKSPCYVYGCWRTAIYMSHSFLFFCAFCEYTRLWGPTHYLHSLFKNIYCGHTSLECTDVLSGKNAALSCMFHSVVFYDRAPLSNRWRASRFTFFCVTRVWSFQLLCLRALYPVIIHLLTTCETLTI